MPYGVKKQGDKWVKYRTDTGKVVSHHDTKEKAEASIRAYYAQKGKQNESFPSYEKIYCENCGKEITDKDFESENFKYGNFTPDTAFGPEKQEFFHKKCPMNEAPFGGSYGRNGKADKKELYKDLEELDSLDISEQTMNNPESVLYYAYEINPQKEEQEGYKTIAILFRRPEGAEKWFYFEIRDYELKDAMKQYKQLGIKKTKEITYDEIQNMKKKNWKNNLNTMNEGIDPKGSKNIVLNVYGEQESVKIKMEKYNNGATACVLLSSDGMPFATLSMNVAGKSETLPKGEFFLKDYSENSEIADQLIKQGILVPTGKQAELPHAVVKSYKVSNAHQMPLNEADPKVNDYKITYIDKNGKPQEMTATVQDYKQKVDDLKKAGNKSIAAAKVTDVVKEQKLRQLIRQQILKELKNKDKKC